MSEELKPCPFCGSGACVYRDLFWFRVNCPNNHGRCALSVYTDPFRSRQAAIDAWNLRSEPAGKETK